MTSHKVQVAVNQRGVTLPDGKVYVSGAQPILSASDYAKVSGLISQGILIDMGTVPDPLPSGDLATEVSRAEAAETANTGAINTNTTAITNEVTRATTAEGTNATNIAANATAISNEATTARAAEALAAKKASNLSDLASVSAARGNLNLGWAAAPAWAGERTNQYDKRHSGYNWKSSNTRRLHAALGKAGTGLGVASIAVVGDSLSQGANSGTAFDRLNSWPLVMRRRFAAMGVPRGGDGVVMCGTWPASTPAAFDPRLSNTAAWTNNGGYLSSTTNGNTLTFTSLVPGTIVDFFYFDNSSASMTVSIDGGAAVAVTRGGGFAISRYRVTGLPNTTHTVLVTQTSTGTAAPVGFAVSSATGLLVHNLGVFGSKAQEWAADTTDLTTLQLAGRTMADSVAAPQVVWIALGANDLAAARTPAQIKADIQTIIGFYSATADVILAAETQSSTMSAATLEPYISALYDLADTNDIPLVDWYDRTGGYTNASANGLMGTDNTHMTIAAYDDFGTIAATLCTAPGGTALALFGANNLSDLADAPTARTNLGLGTAATHPASDFVSAAVVRASLMTQMQAPTGALGVTMPRYAITSSTLNTMTTGRLQLFAISLLAGDTITSVSFTTGTSAGTNLTHRWAALYSSSLSLIRQSADDTSASWAASTVQVYTLTSTYTVPTSGVYYIGLMVAGTNMPTLVGAPAPQGVANGVPPFTTAPADMGLTTTAPATATPGAAGASGAIWGWVS